MAKSKGARPAAPRSIGAVLEIPPRVDLGSYFLKHTILPPQDADWLLVRPEGQSVLIREDLIGPGVSDGPDRPTAGEKEPVPAEPATPPAPPIEAPPAEIPSPRPAAEEPAVAEPIPDPLPAESLPGETAAGESGRTTAEPFPEERVSVKGAQEAPAPAPAGAKEATPPVEAPATEPPPRQPAGAIPPAPDSAGSARESLVRGGVEEMVVFSMGGQLFGTEILKVKEIIRMPEPTPTPQAPPFVRGIVNLRGTVVPVVELRDLLGMPGSGSSKNPYLMIANASGLTVGVIVDGISRVIKISGESLEEYQGGVLGSGSGGEAVWGVVKEGDLLVSLIDLDVVFREPRFHALRSRG